MKIVGLLVVLALALLAVSESAVASRCGGGFYAGPVCSGYGGYGAYGGYPGSLGYGECRAYGGYPGSLGYGGYGGYGAYGGYRGYGYGGCEGVYQDSFIGVGPVAIASGGCC